MLRAAAVQMMAEDYMKLDERRLQLDKESRELKKSLENLREELQNMVGIAETFNIPHVVTVGSFCIAQVKKHRSVQAHEYDYVEFKVVEVPTPNKLSK